MSEMNGRLSELILETPFIRFYMPPPSAASLRMLFEEWGLAGNGFEGAFNLAVPFWAGFLLILITKKTFLTGEMGPPPFGAMLCRRGEVYRLEQNFALGFFNVASHMRNGCKPCQYSFL